MRNEEAPVELPHSSFLVLRFVLFALGAVALLANPARSQPSDPRPSECWSFVFGPWKPALDWAAAGHAAAAPHVRLPPAPEASSTGGAPRHDAAHHPGANGPSLVLYPTWWPVGVGITLEREAALGDTVRGVAHAFVADGRRTPPQSRILARKVVCEGRGEREEGIGRGKR